MYVILDLTSAMRLRKLGNWANITLSFRGSTILTKTSSSNQICLEFPIRSPKTGTGKRRSTAFLRTVSLLLCRSIFLDLKKGA